MIHSLLKNQYTPCFFSNEQFVFSEKVVNKLTTQYELILNHQDYDVTLVDAPAVPENEMRQALKWEARKLFSDYDGKLLFDFYPQPYNHPATKQVINIVSTEKVLIEKIKNKAKSEGLKLKKISIPEIAYKRYVLHSSEHLNQCILVANEQIGKVIIFNQGDICFSRRFSLLYQKQSRGEDFDLMILLELQRSLDYYERQYRLPLPQSFLIVSDLVSDDFTKRVRENVSQHVNLYKVSDNENIFPSVLPLEHYFLLCTIKP